MLAALLSSSTLAPCVLGAYSRVKYFGNLFGGGDFTFLLEVQFLGLCSGNLLLGLKPNFG